MIKFNVFILLYCIMIGLNNDVIIKYNVYILLYCILIGLNNEIVLFV